MTQVKKSIASYIQIKQSNCWGPSPFLLNATIKYHMESYRREDPDFSDKMKSSFFVDDIVTGTDSVRGSI